MVREDRERICFWFIFACVVNWQKPKTPKFSLIADDAISWGGIGGLRSLVYICGITLSIW